MSAARPIPTKIKLEGPVHQVHVRLAVHDVRRLREIAGRLSASQGMVVHWMLDLFTDPRARHLLPDESKRRAEG